MRGRPPVLLVATVLSALLHGAVWDWWRADGSTVATTFRTTLRARMVEPIPIATPLPIATAKPEPESETPLTRGTFPQPTVPQRVPARAGPGRGDDERPRYAARNPEEALIAYRLALADALPPPGRALPGPAVWRLTIRADGTVAPPALLQSCGDGERDRSLARRLAAAARRAPIPTVLREQGFALDVTLE